MCFIANAAVSVRRGSQPTLCRAVFVSSGRDAMQATPKCGSVIVQRPTKKVKEVQAATFGRPGLLRVRGLTQNYGNGAQRVAAALFPIGMHMHTHDEKSFSV